MTGERLFTRPVFARARRRCLAYPETTERSSWGHPNFRAGRKTFCAFEVVKGRPSIAFRLLPSDIDRVLRRPQFFATPYGRGAWASIWVDRKVDWPLVESLIDRSYRVVANKRMLKALDSGRS